MFLAAALLCWESFSPVAAQRGDNAESAIRTTLSQWTADFNARRIDKVCDLFALDLIAQFRGQPETNYSALCDQLMRSVTDGTKAYSYSLALKEILVFGEIAIVRLIWTLKVERAGTHTVTTEETGLDVFRRQADGSWKIVRFIGYD